jgi:HD superfamily phosphohydrolase
VDIQFLIDQATLGEDGRFCFGPRAVRAADHLLISRYYDYMQVAYHKTVAALEWSLMSGLRACLDRGRLDCSAEAIDRCIHNGAWIELDDQHIVGLFRQLSREILSSEEPEDHVLRDHLNGIINRCPPKLIASWEEVSLISDATHHSSRWKLAEASVAAIARKHSIAPGRLHVWKNTTTLSSVPGNVDANRLDDGEVAKAVHILNARTKTAELLVNHKEALLHQLSARQFTGVRVYYLPERGIDDRTLRTELCTDFEEAIGSRSSVYL